jgi:AraC family transcriptional regulator of adaptative response / DNA-3-methyladenine glycosylase II
MSFDGWLTHGVVTTGIYCRPSCPGRPKPENVRVFEDVAAARAAGMRACKRCRPDEAAGGAVVRHLSFSAPLDADGLIAFFGRRAVPGSRSSTARCTGAACGWRAGSRWWSCGRWVT